jgi:hypothetical protein
MKLLEAARGPRVVRVVLVVGKARVVAVKVVASARLVMKRGSCMVRGNAGWADVEGDGGRRKFGSSIYGAFITVRALAYCGTKTHVGAQSAVRVTLAIVLCCL